LFETLIQLEPWNFKLGFDFVTPLFLTM